MRKEPGVFPECQQGSKSVMVWGTMSYNEISNLMLIIDKQTSITYTEALLHPRLDLVERTVGDTF